MSTVPSPDSPRDVESVVSEDRPSPPGDLSLTPIPSAQHPFLTRPDFGPSQVKVWRACTDLCGSDQTTPISIFAIAEATDLSPESVRSVIRRFRARARLHPESFSWPFSIHEHGLKTSIKSIRKIRVRGDVPDPPNPLTADTEALGQNHDQPTTTSLAVVARQELNQWHALMRRWHGPDWRARFKAASLEPPGGSA